MLVNHIPFSNEIDLLLEDKCKRSEIPVEVFLSNIPGLNVQQRDLFQKVFAAVENDLQGQANQLLLLITGGAGRAKKMFRLEITRGTY